MKKYSLAQKAVLVSGISVLGIAAAIGNPVDVMSLSPDRMLLVKSMPGEAGVGYGAWRTLDGGVGDLSGPLVDANGEKVLELEAIITTHQTLLPAPPSGEIYGEVYWPSDGSGVRKPVGFVFGEWMELDEQGFGLIQGQIFERTQDPSAEKVLAGIFEGRFRLDQGPVPIGPPTVVIFDAPPLPANDDDLSDNDGQGLDDDLSDNDGQYGQSSAYPGPNDFFRNGVDVFADAPISTDASAAETETGAADGRFRLRWKIFQ